MQTNIKSIILKNKNLHLLVSSSWYNSENEFIDNVALMLKNGVKLIQYKDNKSSKDILRIGQKLRQLCSIYEALFIIYDRIDLAKILEADGVHFDCESIKLKEAKKILDNDFIIGITAYNTNDIVNAVQYNIDYVILDYNFNSDINLNIPDFKLIKPDKINPDINKIAIFDNYITPDNINKITDFLNR